MNIKIDKDSSISIHKQIYNQIVIGIEKGNVLDKQKLLPERELAEILNVSRGTVKKAYEGLINSGYAIAEQGSGTFALSSKSQEFDEGDDIRLQIDSLILKLKDTGFGFDEIGAMFKMRLLQIKNRNRNINIAAIDCNYEVLKIAKEQISLLENVNYMVFLLNDILESKNPEEFLKDYDVIFTTSTHYDDVCNCIGNLKYKVIKSVMSVDKDTVMKLSTIKKPFKTGVITKSQRFGDIISHNLNYMKLEMPSNNYALIDDLSSEEFDYFTKDKDVLILPPLYAMELSEKLSHKLFEFNHRGGDIILFNYTIERGSIIYIEERILNALNKT